MAAPRLLPSDSTLQKWVDQGLTHRQIAERIKQDTGVIVSRSTVSAALSRAGLTHRVRYDDVIPWHVKAEHNNDYPAQLLRTHARVKRGLPVQPAARRRYESWIQRLREEDAVVAYVPDSPDGWYYVPRRKGIDKDIIREPA